MVSRVSKAPSKTASKAAKAPPKAAAKSSSRATSVAANETSKAVPPAPAPAPKPSAKVSALTLASLAEAAAAAPPATDNSRVGRDTGSQATAQQAQGAASARENPSALAANTGQAPVGSVISLANATSGQATARPRQRGASARATSNVAFSNVNAGPAETAVSPVDGPTRPAPRRRQSRAASARASSALVDASREAGMAPAASDMIVTGTPGGRATTTRQRGPVSARAETATTEGQQSRKRQRPQSEVDVDAQGGDPYDPSEDDMGPGDSASQQQRSAPPSSMGRDAQIYALEQRLEQYATELDDELTDAAFRRLEAKIAVATKLLSSLRDMERTDRRETPVLAARQGPPAESPAVVTQEDAVHKHNRLLLQSSMACIGTEERMFVGDSLWDAATDIAGLASIRTAVRDFTCSREDLGEMWRLFRAAGKGREPEDLAHPHTGSTRQSTMARRAAWTFLCDLFGAYVTELVITEGLASRSQAEAVVARVKKTLLQQAADTHVMTWREMLGNGKNPYAVQNIGVTPENDRPRKDPNLVCSHCRKTGHLVADCRRLKTHQKWKREAHTTAYRQQAKGGGRQAASGPAANPQTPATAKKQ